MRHSMPGERFCTKCGEAKPATLEYFHAQKYREDGTALLKGRCILCARDDNKAYRVAVAEYKQAIREGREPPPNAHKPEPKNKGAFPTLPANQLAAQLDSYMMRMSLTEEAFARHLGMAAKRLREYREDGKRCEFNKADKALCVIGLHWWEVWTEENTDEDDLGNVEFAFTGERRSQERLWAA